jgi:hypothetical protein
MSELYLKAHFMSNETVILARGFDSMLMKCLPELFCSEVKPSSIYSKRDYISLLVKASTLNSYVEGTGNVSRKRLNVRKGERRLPTGETALTYFKTIDRFKLQSVVGLVIEDQLNKLKKIGLFDKPVPIAFDWHDQMFYGDANADMVTGTKPKDGSCYAYEYMTASIIVDGKRLTLTLVPIKSREHLLSYVEYALAQIKNMGVKIRYLLFDGGFSSTSLPIYLEKHGYRYVLHFTPNSATKRANLNDGESAFYRVDGEHKQEQSSFFKIVRADDPETGIKYLFATNMDCKSKHILMRYKARWCIETSYRKHNEFLARTTSKNYVVRLLYYSVAVCIYNCWCILNALQGQEREKDREHIIVLEVKLSLLFEIFSLLQT